ncbi:uncharacterized protein [Dysidea avara]|uniref:uncharacterized protein isoform X2 n=1 Tax=Dysidea avara TaxID=196820 RepID=UPI0033344051
MLSVKMARTIFLLQSSADNDYRYWATRNLHKYFEFRLPPYYSAFIFGNIQDSSWLKVDDADSAAMATKHFTSHWPTSDMMRQDTCSRDLHHLIDILQGHHPIIDVIWFVDDLNDFHLEACLLGALARMRSHHPASHVNIVMKEQPPNNIPDFVRLLSATLLHGDDTCLASLAAVVPVWRGQLLLHHNQDKMILGGLHLDCCGSVDKHLTSDLVMEAIQVIPTPPLQWVCPTEYKLSSRHDNPVASLLQAVENQYLLVRFVHCSSDVAMEIADDNELCNYEELLILGRKCISCDQQVTCNAWFLRKPEDFLPLPYPFHIKSTQCGDDCHSNQLVSLQGLPLLAPSTLSSEKTEMKSFTVEDFCQCLLSSCHELDCDQSDWPEMRLLRDKDKTECVPDKIIVPIPTPYDDNLDQVLNKFGQDGSCDHSSELSPVKLEHGNTSYQNMFSEGEHQLTHMSFKEACHGSYHGISYCLSSDESYDSKLAKIQQNCVAMETHCSHDQKDQKHPTNNEVIQEQNDKPPPPVAIVKPKQSHKGRHSISTKRKRSVRHKKRLQVVVLNALKERGVSRDHMCFKNCYKRLFNLSRSFLKDLQSSRNLTNEMKQVASSNVQQVIEFECRRAGLQAPPTESNQ